MKPNAITPMEMTVTDARIANWVQILRDRRSEFERAMLSNPPSGRPQSTD